MDTANRGASGAGALRMARWISLAAVLGVGAPLVGCGDDGAGADMAAVDMTMATDLAAPDLTSSDLTAMADLTVMADLSAMVDLSAGPDLVTMIDLAAPDLLVARDLAGGAADLAPAPVDLAAAPDLTQAGTLRVTTLATGSLASPYGLALDTQGPYLWVADYAGHAVFRIATADGSVSVVAGTPGAFGLADGIAGAAKFKYPTAVAVDPSGVVWVADSGNHVIRKITVAGANVTVSTVAGSLGALKGFKDGTGGAALFNAPMGITLDATGANAFVGENMNCTLRQVTATGVVTTVAGDGNCTALGTYYVRHIARDPSGMIYISDPSNHRIRAFAGGQFTVVAGPSGGFGTSGKADGPAAQATFNGPYGVAIESATSLLVADSNNHRIRRITLGASSAVSTVAGIGFGKADGDPLTQAQFAYPRHAIAAGDGTIYIADTDNKAVRRIGR